MLGGLGMAEPGMPRLHFCLEVGRFRVHRGTGVLCGDRVGDRRNGGQQAARGAVPVAWEGVGAGDQDGGGGGGSVGNRHVAGEHLEGAAADLLVDNGDKPALVESRGEIKAQAV